MKKFAFIISAIAVAAFAMGQGNKNCNSIDTLIGKGQYASAYILAQEQYNQAQKSGGTELLQAAFYLTALDYAYNNDATDSAIMRYSHIAHLLHGTDRAVAYTFLFHTYNALYLMNSSRLKYNKPSDDPKLNYSKWHIGRMEDTLLACADSVLAYSDLLRNTTPQHYLEMMTNDSQQPIMDSSLLGMLVQELLPQQTYDVYVYKFTSEQLYDLQRPLTFFCATPPDSTLPYQWQLYRRIAEQYKEASADEMLWLDLKRIALPSGFHLRSAAIDSLERHYGHRLQSEEMTALMRYQKAQYLSYEDKRVEAEHLCLETEKAFPNTYGASCCRVLRRDICLPAFNIKTSTKESSKCNRLAVVEARNISTLNFRIVSVPDVFTDEIRTHCKSDTLLHLPAVAEWQQALPDVGDHLNHRHLVAIPSLPQGNYVLVAFTDSIFNYLEFESTDAAFIAYSTSSSANRSTYVSPSSGYLIDRVTGRPLANKRVTMYSETSFNDREKRRHYRTDKEGYFHFPVSSPRYIFSDVKKISAKIDGYEYYYNDDGWSSIYSTCYFQKNTHKLVDIVMTDRPIYRLGDTVRFCCIAYRTHTHGKTWQTNVKPSTNIKLKASFYYDDDYSDDGDTLMLKTDKHGRCWGEFVIDKNGRNGSYYLEISGRGYYVYKQIEVEAYKPPRFSVMLSTTQFGDNDTAERGKGSLRRFDEPIAIYGIAMSYNGAPMTGAKVSWKVGCNAMPNPQMAYATDLEYPHLDSLILGGDGKFEIRFTPNKNDIKNVSGNSNLSDTKNKLQAYIYSAKVNVMDADGENHEQELSFHVSDADGYCILTSGDLNQLTFAYNNFDHEPLEGEVHIELFQLRQPDTLRTLDPLMEKYPDAKWTGTRDEFRRLFPDRAFCREEYDKKLWPVVTKHYDNTTKARKLELSDLPSGVYQVRFSTPDGVQHDTVVIHVAKDGRVTGNDVVWVRPNQTNHWMHLTCRIGDTLRFEMGSPYGNQPVYYRINHAAKTYKRGMMVVDSSHTSLLTLPITEKMKDGCIVSLTAMRNGQDFAAKYYVNVVRPDRIIDINTESFRDRLHPGEQEQWRLRLTCPETTQSKNVKGLAANLCLTMYDISLEQYAHPRIGFWPWNRRNHEMHVFTENFNMESGFINNKFKPMSIHQYAQSMPLIGRTLPDIANYYILVKNRFDLLNSRFWGQVVDKDTKEPIAFALIEIKQDGKLLYELKSDINGIFQNKTITEGEYQIHVTVNGYQTLKQKVKITQQERYFFSITLSPSESQMQYVVMSRQKIPVIDIGSPENGTRLTADDISRMPGPDVESIVAQLAGVGYDDGSGTGTARGENGMVTMTNGVRKRTGINVPKEAIAEIQLPLQFEDNTGEAPDNIRKNFTTLALFEPSLRSDENGYVTVNFTMPDALTQWRLAGFAWSDSFQSGFLKRTVQTQKELMVQPQLPRFLRQGDTIEILCKVSNLSDSAMTVTTGFDFSDAGNPTQHRQTAAIPLFIAAHSSKIANCKLKVDEEWHVANYKVFATTEQTNTIHHSDGEQGQLPVLSNRERIVESRLLYIAGITSHSEKKNASFSIPLSELGNSRLSPTDTITISFTPDPLNYAIEALPHFKRHFMPGNIYLANSIYIEYITSLIAPLTEKERLRAANRAKKDLTQLLQSQCLHGGWSWMPLGKEENRYITESILQRIVSCKELVSDKYNTMRLTKALSSFDEALVGLYMDFLNDTTSLSKTKDNHSMLYTRSLYFDIKPLDKCDSMTQQAYRHYYRQCKMKCHNEIPLYQQGQMALLMLHMGDTLEAIDMANRIKGASHTSPQMGMYWRDNVSGYGWYQRPIETAALLVDVFADVLNDWESVNRIQQWILSSKQGTTWQTDMATACAVAALVRQPNGNNIADVGKVTLTVNGKNIDGGQTNITPIAKQTADIAINMTSSSPLPAWGAVFYSHELPIDSIKYNGTGITLRKTLSRVNTDGSLTLLTPESTLHLGDRIRVHIDIHCDRDMDNMVFSDQRASAFEPTNTSSGWRWNKGLHYYVDMRDDRSDCYIDRLIKGHYEIEYDMWVRHTGTFINGISILRSVYAPEFRANTASEKIKIE